MASWQTHAQPFESKVSWDSSKVGPVGLLVTSAMQAGGPAMLKAWSGPFFDIRFCPTGGVSLQNASEFVALPNVVCVGGSWLVPADAMAQGDWAKITQLAADSVALRK